MGIGERHVPAGHLRLDHRALRINDWPLTPTVRSALRSGRFRTHGGGVLLPSLLFAGNHRSAHSHARSVVPRICGATPPLVPSRSIGHAVPAAVLADVAGLATPPQTTMTPPAQATHCIRRSTICERHWRHWWKHARNPSKPASRAAAYPRATDRHRGGIGTLPCWSLVSGCRPGRRIPSIRSSVPLAVLRQQYASRSANCRSTQSCLNWGAWRTAIWL